MLKQSKRPLVTGISYAVVISFMLAGLFVAGCGRPSSDSTESSSLAAPANDAPVGVVLRADPNPVPGGTETGKTTIIWQTGSEAVADIYSVSGTEETLFASGVKGSKEASVRPGSNEFRLYNAGQHKLVAQLIVAMPESTSAASSAPAGSPSP